MKDLIDKRLIKLIKACDEAESKEDLLDIRTRIWFWPTFILIKDIVGFLMKCGQVTEQSKR